MNRITTIFHADGDDAADISGGDRDSLGKASGHHHRVHPDSADEDLVCVCTAVRIFPDRPLRALTGEDAGEEGEQQFPG